MLINTPVQNDIDQHSMSVVRNRWNFKLILYSSVPIQCYHSLKSVNTISFPFVSVICWQFVKLKVRLKTKNTITFVWFVCLFQHVIFVSFKAHKQNQKNQNQNQPWKSNDWTLPDNQVKLIFQTQWFSTYHCESRPPPPHISFPTFFSISSHPINLLQV